MGTLSGDLSSLRQSDLADLKRLWGRKTGSRAIVSMELSKLASAIACRLGREIGVLINRQGHVETVIVGSKNRLYLPDLGRFRLGAGRLRRLRLVLFMPPGSYQISSLPQTVLVQDVEHYRRIAGKESFGNAEKMIPNAVLVPLDNLTDLQKLRLDCVFVVAVSKDSEPLSASLATIEVGSSAVHPFMKNNNIGSSQCVSLSHFRSLYDCNLDFEELMLDLEKQLSIVKQASIRQVSDRAIVVGVYTGSYKAVSYAINELLELARTAGVDVVDTNVQRRKSIDPKTIIGKGKVEEIALHALELEADLLLFDRELSPSQLRNITQVTELRVIDRSMLILDIFAQRAKTREGRLQVELAQLKYSLPRLTEKDSGLSRLTGGIGGRGPGETKLEISRRRTRDRIADLERRIDEIAAQRELRRSLRQGRGVPVIAIVGYTNAGKSTLLNALTKGDVFVENKLFATLDPASRRMRFPNEREVIFVDTVGFIRELPDELVRAFRATLEEVGEADLLVQLVDASSPDAVLQGQVVMRTLEDLGFGLKPRLTVLNKIDLISALEAESLRNAFGECILVSAVKRFGLDTLLLKCQEILAQSFHGQDPGGFLYRVQK